MIGSGNNYTIMKRGTWEKVEIECFWFTMSIVLSDLANQRFVYEWR